jgi:Arc/MetJ family transcription regulator
MRHFVYNKAYLYTREVKMRTNVVIDDDLMKSALKFSGLKTKKDIIEAGLQLLVKFNRQTRVKDFRGRLKWAGNLDEMRTDK